MELDFNTFYRSEAMSHLVEQETVVLKAAAQGVITSELQMAGEGGDVRGVLKSSAGEVFYVTLNLHSDHFTLRKASNADDVTSLGNMFDSMSIGCHMIKAAESTQVSGIASVSEEDMIEQDRNASTKVHPGAAGISTPDRPEVGRKWHEDAYAKSWDASALLSGLNDDLRKSTAQLVAPLSEQEKQFMEEVMGKTPGQISSGKVKMTPHQKVTYRQWLGKSMHGSVVDLKKWMGE